MTLTITHPDTLLFPGVSKADLADYYEAVAAAMLPHLRGRPLAMQRFPEGIDGDGFIQKQLPAHAPGFVHHADVPKVDGGSVTMLVCDNRNTLRYLANQAAITLHSCLAPGRRPRKPDRLVLDMDPPGDLGADASKQFAVARGAALAARELFADLSVPAYVMTTGSRGLHVTVPLAGKDDVDDVLALARDLADLLVARNPRAFTTAVRRADRDGRLYVDALRNGYAQQAVAPYSVRPLPTAPVAAPLAWEELEDRGLGPRTFTVRNVTERPDPWQSFPRHGPSVATIRGQLAKLVG